MTVGSLRDLLGQFPPAMQIVVLSDGVEEIPFDAPILSRMNVGTPDDFVAINVILED